MKDFPPILHKQPAVLHPFRNEERSYSHSHPLADEQSREVAGHLIHQLFEAQAARIPHAIAIEFATIVETFQQTTIPHNAAGLPNSPPASLTYQELNHRANQLAHHLRALGVGGRLGKETLVGLAVDRSLEMVIGLLAILKAGGAYVPLDPNYPDERLAFMIEDADLALLLTQSHLRNKVPLTNARQVYLDQDRLRIGQQPVGNLDIPVQGGNLAYVIYTSGSTGRPKGVLIEHSGLANLAQVQRQTFGVQPGDRVLQFSSLNFDASVWEICMALCSGATLYVAPTDALLPGPVLTRFLSTHAITHVTLVPSVLAVLVPTELPDLRTVIVAGEACPSPLARRWLPDRRFFNAYGPTETTVCATIMACTEETLSPVAPPIGQAITNVQLYILDDGGNPVPDGAVGELYIGGSTLARGYLNRPALTAEKFVASPFAPDGHPLRTGSFAPDGHSLMPDRSGTSRLYKTGDLVRRRSDGNLDFLGRIDHQVKVRGHRIELGEIEALLTNHPQVQQAVVVAKSAPNGQPQLVAYVELKEVVIDAVVIDKDAIAHQAIADHVGTRLALRRFLQNQLPDYMIPAAFVLMAALPLMPNGKVDRQALPTPQDDAFATEPFAPPSTPTEVALATI